MPSGPRFCQTDAGRTRLCFKRGHCFKRGQTLYLQPVLPALPRATKGLTPF